MASTKRRTVATSNGMLEVIINFRTEHFLSQSEMAILLGIKRSYLGLMEQQQRPVTEAVENRFIRLQVELMSKKSLRAPGEDVATSNNNVPPVLQLKWTIRAKDLEFKLLKLERIIEELPDGKERSTKIDNLGHLVDHFVAPEPVKNFFKDKHRNLTIKTPVQFQQTKLELELKAELLKFEMELLKKYLGAPDPGV